MITSSSGDYSYHLPFVARMNPWQEVGPGSASNGGISSNSGGAYWPVVAVSPNGTPYVI
jgi:hypothetical protein